MRKATLFIQLHSVSFFFFSFCLATHNVLHMKKFCFARLGLKNSNTEGWLRIVSETIEKWVLTQYLKCLL